MVAARVVIHLVPVIANFAAFAHAVAANARLLSAGITPDRSADRVVDATQRADTADRVIRPTVRIGAANRVIRPTVRGNGSVPRVIARVHTASLDVYTAIIVALLAISTVEVAGTFAAR